MTEYMSVTTPEKEWSRGDVCPVQGIYVCQTDEWYAECKEFKKSVPKLEEEELNVLYPRIQPLIVQMGSGMVEVTKSNLLYLRKLVRLTLQGVRKSQEGNT